MLYLSIMIIWISFQSCIDSIEILEGLTDVCQKFIESIIDYMYENIMFCVYFDKFYSSVLMRFIISMILLCISSLWNAFSIIYIYYLKQF